MTFDIPTTFTIISAMAAIISVLFAWRAVKVAEKSNAIGLLGELHGIYRSESIFHSTRIVWDTYNELQDHPDGETPITPEQAMRFVREAPDKSPETWKATHDLIRFWGYLALLVNQGYIKESIALAAFGTPRILGFLYPVEAAFAEYRKKTYNYDTSLKHYYDRWNKDQQR